MKHFANFNDQPVRRTVQVAAMATLTTLLLAVPTAAHAAVLSSNFNTGGVSNMPISFSGTFPLTMVSLSSPADVTQLVTYHWNNGQGEAPGTITIRSLPSSISGSRFSFNGTFPAQGQPGSFNVPNVNWVADVHVTLPEGDYVVFDSSPSTWSQNSQSSGQGFVMVLGDSLQPATLFNNFNTFGVVNQPTTATTFQLTEPAQITQLRTYHWDDGRGHKPGRHDHITLSGFGAPMNFPVVGEPGGNGNVKNATWIAFGLDVVLPPGTYTISDSSPSTWAQNSASNGAGFAQVLGNSLSPQVQVPAPQSASGTGGGATTPPTMSCGVPAYFVVMAPCSAFAGTPMTLTVVNPLPAPIATVTFYCVGAPFGPGNFCGTPLSPTQSLIDVTVLPAGLTITGTGIAVGSVYTFPVPIFLMVGGPSSQWEAIAVDTTGASLGTVGIFTLL